MSMRKLILHPGGGKAGSSALQTFFFKNRENLRAHGIEFAEVGNPKQIPQGGNGIPLLKSVGEETFNLFQKYMADSDVSLVSSEDIGLAHPNEWKRILAVGCKMSIQLHIVFVTRNIYPLYFSQWMQTMKHHQPLDFPSFAAASQFIHKRFFDYFCEDTHGVKVTVLHYDSIKKNIAKAFLNAIGVDHSEFVFSTESINRGFTYEEMVLIQQIHRQGVTRDTSGLWRTWVQRWPNLNSYFEVFPQVIELLESRHSDELNRINDAFFDGRPVLKVIDPDVNKGGNIDRVAQRFRAQKHRDLCEVGFEWAIGELKK